MAPRETDRDTLTEIARLMATLPGEGRNVSLHGTDAIAALATAGGKRTDFVSGTVDRAGVLERCELDIGDVHFSAICMRDATDEERAMLAKPDQVIEERSYVNANLGGRAA